MEEPPPMFEPATEWPRPGVQIAVTPKEFIAANLRTVANDIDRGVYNGNMGESLCQLKFLNGQLDTLQASYQTLGEEMSAYLYNKYKYGEMRTIGQLAIELRKLADKLDPTIHKLDR